MVARSRNRGRRNDGSRRGSSCPNRVGLVRPHIPTHWSATATWRCSSTPAPPATSGSVVEVRASSSLRATRSAGLEGGWSIDFEILVDRATGWHSIWLQGAGGHLQRRSSCSPEPPAGVSYTLECAEMDATSEGIEHIFTNTGTIGLRIFVTWRWERPDIPQRRDIPRSSTAHRDTYELGTKIQRCRVATEGSQRDNSPSATRSELTYSARCPHLSVRVRGSRWTNTGDGRSDRLRGDDWHSYRVASRLSRTRSPGERVVRTAILLPDPTAWDTCREGRRR